jgi:hypothetical protein
MSRRTWDRFVFYPDAQTEVKVQSTVKEKDLFRLDPASLNINDKTRRVFGRTNYLQELHVGGEVGSFGRTGYSFDRCNRPSEEARNRKLGIW